MKEGKKRLPVVSEEELFLANEARKLDLLALKNLPKKSKKNKGKRVETPHIDTFFKQEGKSEAMNKLVAVGVLAIALVLVVSASGCVQQTSTPSNETSTIKEKISNVTEKISNVTTKISNVTSKIQNLTS